MIFFLKKSIIDVSRKKEIVLVILTVVLATSKIRLNEMLTVEGLHDNK